MIRKRHFPMAVLLVTALSMAVQAHAALVTLEPIPGNQITSGVQIENYFNGGQDSYNNPGNGDPAGPSDHVIFPTGGTGGAGTYNTTYFDSLSAGKVTGSLPSGANDVFVQTVSSVMNIAAGYAGTSLSFDYSTYASSAQTVTLWSGANGTGTSSVITLSQNDFTSGPSANCTTSHHCAWTLDTANLAAIGGLVKSVTFGGTLIGDADFDSIQMNIVPVPVPAGLPLLLSGAAALGFLVRSRRFALV